MDQSSLRNLFEVNNARTQSIEEVVRTFVPLDSFWRLINGKNHILLGSRGSGKTAVLRMLAHDHLSKFEHSAARTLIERRTFIGTFVPMRADWIGTLKNKPWHSQDSNAASFQWRLNLSCCVAFLDTAGSCLAQYSNRSERAFIERDLARMLSKSWLVGANRSVDNLLELRSVLEDVEWNRQVTALPSLAAESNSLGAGSVFDMELFIPINRGIQVLKRVIKFPNDTVWALALDELEFLEPYHHELINTFLRAKSEMAFKLSTMPYFHHTLGTKTTQPLVAGNDFDYVYLDNDPGIRRTDRSSWVSWAEEVIGRRISFVEQTETSGFSLAKLLGHESPLIDEKPSNWGPDSSMIKLFKTYSSEQTVMRASRLPPDRFKDEIARKMHAMLLLRAQAGRQKGHSQHELYSGPKFFALCSDANPRQLIRLFNELTLMRTTATELNIREHVRPVNQAKAAIAFSGEALRNASTEEGIGGELYEFLRQLMEHFRSRFYDRPLTTDYFYSIRVTDRLSDYHWKLVQYSVGLGLMFPKVSFNQPDLLPDRQDSEFNMAYRLAPKFGLLPRKGKAVSISAALSGKEPRLDTQFSLI